MVARETINEPGSHRNESTSMSNNNNFRRIRKSRRTALATGEEE
jgi:hypothetical protein